MLSQLDAPFSLAGSSALLEEVPHLSAIALNLAWSSEFSKLIAGQLLLLYYVFIV